MLKDDRLEGVFDLDTFETWTRHGGHFSILGVDGKVRAGQIHFNKGTLYGSVHQGYQLQGYTSKFTPRIHWNIRRSRGEVHIDTQIDMDYRDPWKFGFIPNPLHLRHDNSLVLDHFQTYARRFGSPGFSVTQPPSTECVQNPIGSNHPTSRP